MRLLARASYLYHTEGFPILVQMGVKHLAQRCLQESLARYYSRAHQYQPASGLPTVLTVPEELVKYKSTFVRRQFPTYDKWAKKEATPHSRPVVGVLGGPWDQCKQPWEKSGLYRSLQQRFEQGIPWEETEKYQSAFMYIDRGHKAWSSYSFSELDEKTAKIDQLYESMKQYGYLSQTELRTQEDIPIDASGTIQIHGREFPRESRVGIGRNGEIIRIEEGRHRIGIAKILDIDSIPVLVVVRHKRWERIRNAFDSADSISEVPERWREFVGHPDVPEI